MDFSEKFILYFVFSRLVVYMCFTSPEDNMEENTLISHRFQWDCSITYSEMFLIYTKARGEPGWIFYDVLHCSSLASQCFCSFLSSQASATRISSKALMNHVFFTLYPRFSSSSFWLDPLCLHVLILPYCLAHSCCICLTKTVRCLVRTMMKIKKKKSQHVRMMDLEKARTAIKKKKKKEKQKRKKKQHKIFQNFAFYILGPNPAVWSFSAYLCTQEQTQCRQLMNAIAFSLWLLVWCFQSQMTVVYNLHSVWPRLHAYGYLGMAWGCKI